jgi:hypothetical protein
MRAAGAHRYIRAVGHSPTCVRACRAVHPTADLLALTQWRLGELRQPKRRISNLPVDCDEASVTAQAAREFSISGCDQAAFFRYLIDVSTPLARVFAVI